MCTGCVTGIGIAALSVGAGGTSQAVSESSALSMWVLTCHAQDPRLHPGMGAGSPGEPHPKEAAIMRVRSSSVLALALLAGAMLASWSAVPSLAGESPELATPPAPTCSASADFSLPGAEPMELACGRCPNRCSSDAQCTAQCGGFPGSCVQVNSCCRQCLCAGYTVEQSV